VDEYILYDATETFKSQLVTGGARNRQMTEGVFGSVDLFLARVTLNIYMPIRGD
jgi:hypothetical protein